jgi:hypothetical protein
VENSLEDEEKAKEKKSSYPPQNLPEQPLI